MPDRQPEFFRALATVLQTGTIELRDFAKFVGEGFAKVNNRAAALSVVSPTEKIGHATGGSQTSHCTL